MSLIVAIRVEGDQLLFASDKRITQVDSDGFTITTHNNAVKLVPALGGIVGWTGNPDLSIYLLKAVISTCPTGATEIEISRRLADADANRVAKVTQAHGGELDKAKEYLKDDANFIYGIGTDSGCRLTLFQLGNLFIPNVKYDSVVRLGAPEEVYDNIISVWSLGMDRHALSLRQWFKKSKYTLTWYRSP